MTRTIKLGIAEALEDLYKIDFEKFCHQLRDRRGEPRVSRRDVEDKTRYEITDLLVSRFTERRALKVTLEILRQMNCNEQAEKLDLKTKACMDEGVPTFRRTPDGRLETKPSQEAKDLVASRLPLQAVTVKTPDEVEAEAKAQILSEGGDLSNKHLILSQYKIQLGQYKGQPFKWLLENDVGYTAYMVAGHQNERKNTQDQSPLMVNKDSLTRYATVYQEVLKEVKLKLLTLQPGQEGKARLGFGKYSRLTLQGLYNSKDKDKISYVDFLRKQTADPGSRMEDAVTYILQCDNQRARKRPNTSVQRPIQRTRRSYR